MNLAGERRTAAIDQKRVRGHVEVRRRAGRNARSSLDRWLLIKADPDRSMLRGEDHEVGERTEFVNPPAILSRHLNSSQCLEVASMRGAAAEAAECDAETR